MINLTIHLMTALSAWLFPILWDTDTSQSVLKMQLDSRPYLAAGEHIARCRLSAVVFVVR